MSAIRADDATPRRTEGRRQQIRELVGSNGFVTVGEIARLYEISLATARRDIRALSHSGDVHAHWGGAGRSGISDESDAIASLVRTAASFVSHGMTIGVAAGGTALALVNELRELTGLTVVTNSLEAAGSGYSDRTGSKATADFITLPGHIDDNGNLGGPLCVDAISALYLDVVFIAARGFDPRTASFSTRIDDAEVVRAFRRSGARTIFVSPTASWGARSQVAIGPLTDSDTVISDREPSRLDRSAIESVFASLIIAEENS
jgi:DeoR/GlpR family transcriptional regulator of sugar metabolism